MAKEKFVDQKFQRKSLELIDKCGQIITEFAAQGYVLTLRQLYYQLVTRNIIENKQTEYKRVGSLVNDARLAGLLDWTGIEDRTRNVREPPAWRSPEAILSAVASQYQEDPWLAQDFMPEVWIEKDALVGVIEPVCRELRVPYFACRGYTSQSEAYGASKRFRRGRFDDGALSRRRPIVFHLGDHDPSGIDMTRDNRDRLVMFYGGPVELRRLALNMDQIEEYGPPPNPAKENDSRFEGYQTTHGDDSWELDALEPTVIGDLIREAVEGLIDRDRWDEVLRREEAQKEVLTEISDRYDDVKAFLAGDEA